MKVVRLASPADEGSIFDLLMDLWANGTVARLLPYRPEKIFAKIREATERRGGIIGVIDGERPNYIVGSIGIFPDQTWYTDAYIMQQLWLYVRPRDGRGLGQLLGQFANEECQQLANGMARYALDHNESVMPLYLESYHISGDRIAAKDRLWRRFAGERVGSVFVKRFRPANPLYPLYALPSER
jgi:hypothetical protein